MPIQSSDILLKLSVTTGSAGNSVAQGNPNASLGKYISTTQVVNNTVDNCFDDISGDENAAGTTDYRCVFVHNNHATLTLQGAKVWLSGLRCTAAASTDKLTSASHGLIVGDVVRVENEYATDAMPGGLNDTTSYYVVSPTTNDFQLSLTLGGSAIDITSDSTGCAVRKYGNTTVQLAIDNAATSAVGASPAQASFIANELAAPSAIGSFSGPTTKSSALSLGDIPAGQCRAVWFKRTALNAGARNNDSFFIQVAGDTAA